MEELKYVFTAKHHYAPSTIERPDYGAKVEYIKEDHVPPPLSAVHIKHIERVVRKFLYYGRIINITMLHAVHNITSTKNKKTQTTWKAVQYLLNYVASNPDSKIIFCASDTLYKINSDAAYLVCPESRS